MSSPQTPASSSGAVSYFVGAGLGAASNFKLPTSKGFLARVIKDKGNQDIDLAPTVEIHQTLDYIEKWFGQLEHLDLEAVMSDLFVRTYGIGQSWARGDYFPTYKIQRYYDGLLDYIANRLSIQMQLGSRGPLVEAFIQNIEDSDSIITLNYDTILEDALDAMGTEAARTRLRHLRYWIGPPGTCAGGTVSPRLFEGRRIERTGLFVKLHGSIDWLSCANPSCPNHWFIQTDYGLPIRANDSKPMTCTGCGWLPRRVIIPPVSGKPFDTFPKLGVMWREAYSALLQSKRWVFLGISIAETDFHLSSLIRVASRDAKCFDEGQIYIVNTDPDPVKSRLLGSLAPIARQRVLEKDTLVVFKGIEEYLSSVIAVENRKDS